MAQQKKKMTFTPTKDYNPKRQFLKKIIFTTVHKL